MRSYNLNTKIYLSLKLATLLKKIDVLIKIFFNTMKLKLIKQILTPTRGIEEEMQMM